MPIYHIAYLQGPTKSPPREIGATIFQAMQELLAPLGSLALQVPSRCRNYRLRYNPDPATRNPNHPWKQ